MQEIVKNILENGTALWVTFCSFIGVEAGAILGLVIYIIKLRANKEFTKDRLEKFLAAQDMKLNESIEAKIDASLVDFENKVNNVVDMVAVRLKIDSEEKKQAYEDSAKQIQDLIASATENLK